MNELIIREPKISDEKAFIAAVQRSQIFWRVISGVRRDH